MAPRRLGPYVLGEEVSSRGLTVTYRARHAELGRAALLKTLKPTVSAASAFAEGLEREAKILARIRHPNLVEVQDFHREDDAIWLVLEPAFGPTLAALLALAGPLDVDAAAAIALEIARGLGHAHDRGVVHRELRPDRVIVTLSGGVKILEFAAASDGRLPSLPEPFEGGETFARPDYMAPEQILGEPAGPPADVFALGAVLFEMLAGARPFGDPPPDDAARPRAPGPGVARPAAPPGDRWAEGKAVAHRIRSAPPRPLRALCPDVPRALERAVLRCLEKDPELRYADGRALAAALVEALAERGHASPRPLIARALAAAKLCDDAPLPDAPPPRPALEPPRAPSLRPEVRRLAAVFGMIVAGGAVIELGFRDHDAPAAAPEAAALGPPGSPAQRGSLRVLARPWAEVVVDGDLVDVTPMARAILLSPGRHYVTFRHPNAPDEKRTVVLAAGQTVLLDVTMRVERNAVDAGPPPDAARDDSP